MDIVERLRDRCRNTPILLTNVPQRVTDYLCQEAADEIERLRAALRMWVRSWKNDESIDINNDQWMAEEAMEETLSVLKGDE